jgi:hypothetical protein
MMNMNRKAASALFWSAAAVAVFTFLFLVAIAIFTPPMTFDFATYVRDYSFRSIIPAIPCVLLALAHFPFFVSLYGLADESRKPLARIGIAFGCAYALLGSVNYFAQISYVFRNITAGRVAAVGPFLLDDTSSFVFALEALAYTLLFLAVLFLAPLFRERGADPWIRRLFYATSVIGLIGSAGYILNNPSATLGITFAAVTYVIAVALIVVKAARLKKGPPGAAVPRRGAGGSAQPLLH